MNKLIDFYVDKVGWRLWLSVQVVFCTTLFFAIAFFLAKTVVLWQDYLFGA